MRHTNKTMNEKNRIQFSDMEYFYLRHRSSGLFLHLLGGCLEEEDGQKLVLSKGADELDITDDRLPLRWSQGKNIEIMDTGFLIGISGDNSSKLLIGTLLVVSSRGEFIIQLKSLDNGVLVVETDNKEILCIQPYGGVAVAGTTLIVGRYNANFAQQYSFDIVPAEDLL